MTTLAQASLSELVQRKVWPCSCGQCHQHSLKQVLLERAALQKIPSLLQRFRKAFVFFDAKTRAAAGTQVLDELASAGMSYQAYEFPQTEVEPDATALGQLALQIDPDCDVIVAVGSGTLNDLGKCLAKLCRCPYLCVATSPSMDGYASATSSMVVEGVKVSLPSTLPFAIVADLDVLAHAPLEGFLAGYGDMLAKYTSLCDWRVAHLLCGESFCPEIASLVRTAVARCRQAAQSLPERTPELAYALMDGLIRTGIAMALAGQSRPASGTEHYFSHLWDMRGLAFHQRFDRHGLQCLVGTLLTMELYAYLAKQEPNTERAKQSVACFDLKQWNETLTQLLGPVAQELIQLEEKEQKYEPEAHHARLEKILVQWPQLLQILQDELPDQAQLTAELQQIGAPTGLNDLQLDKPELRLVCQATKDIRDKYIVTRLLWDLGLLEEASEALVAQYDEG